MQDLAREGFRLSPQQKYLWALYQATPDQTYRVIGALEIDGGLNSEALKRSLADVVSRHEILRSTFHRPPGMKTPFQVVSEDPRLHWREVDLSGLDAEPQETRVDQFFDAERKQAFDLERGPLLRASCLKLSNNKHALIVTLPALCADQLTLSNLVSEIRQAYESQGQQQADSQLVQYADFAEWQNGLLEADDKVALQARSYWKQQEVNLNPVPVLPLERRQQASRTFDPQSVRFLIGTDVVRSIETVAKEYGTSASVVLLACWEALLWRLTGQADFVVWCLNDGRKIDDLRTAMGLYAKYLPVFCQVGDRTFADYLKQTNVAIAQTEEWQEYFNPLAGAANASDEDANIIAFEFQEGPKKHSPTSFSMSKRFVCIRPFKIKLSFFTEEGSVQSELEYNGQVLDRDSAERIAGYFKQLLVRVVQDPAVEIGAIEILDADEQRHLLFDINQTSADYSGARCIHELFEQQVDKTPDAPAVAYENQVLTYRDLNSRANQVAHLLKKRGIGPESPVALCMNRSVEIIVGLLGILKAGGAYVPLNPEHPPARLEVQLTQSRATVCLTNEGGAGRFENSIKVIDLNGDSILLQEEATSNPTTVTSLENLVYVIFTSGSTGLPKGVAVRHRSLVNYSCFILDKLAINAPLNFATVSTISADLGNTCIFPSLVSGGCLHILSNEMAMEGNRLSKYVSDHLIDVLKIVPSHLNALLTSQEGNVLPAKYLLLGGEVLSWDLIRRLSQVKQTCKIINHYGPTETTVGCLTHDVGENGGAPYSLTVPIGRPIANTRVYLLNQQLKQVPRGVAGELFIGGTGVTDGYWNLPAETAACFLPDPFSPSPNARLYKTGDLARLLPDDTIEFIGRYDHQVKVRGYRIELAEVEAALEEHASVRQAVVLVRAEAGRDEQLVAYLTLSGAKPPTPEDIRHLLTEKLPHYMIPSAFVFLESFPLTANGKLDRAALPAPEQTRPELRKNFVAPRTPAEKEIAEIWSSVLKLSEVGIHDDFFELGGHSLLATQVVARVRKAFQLDVSLRSLFESPTIAEFAQRIESVKDAELSKLLTALEALSEEEAQRLLAMEKAKRRIEN